MRKSRSKRASGLAPPPPGPYCRRLRAVFLCAGTGSLALRRRPFVQSLPLRKKQSGGRRALKLLLLLAAAAAGAQSLAPAPQRRPMEFSDLMKMRRLGDIDLSPDGRWILFTVTDVNLERNTRTPHLWVIPAAGGAEKPLTASIAGESEGRFSPDGKRILFLSPRSGDSQVYLASFDAQQGTAGTAQRLTNLSTGAGGAQWSPDGASILFTSLVYPQCSLQGAEADACNRRRERESEESQVKAQIFTHLLFRHWNGYTGERRSHLFLIPSAGGEARDLIPGAAQDIPPFSLGRPRGYTFSPDSKEIAFEWNTDPVPALSVNSDIFTLRLDDPQAKPVRISGSPGGDFTPRYSPDGRYLAFRSQARAGYESDRFRLMLYDRRSKRTAELLPSFDRWVEDIAWSPDAKFLYFTSPVSGEQPIFRVAARGGAAQAVSGAGVYGSLHPTPDGSALIAARTTLREPAEVFSLPLPAVDSGAKQESGAKQGDGKYAPDAALEAQQAQLTHLNSERLARLDLPEAQSFRFTGAQRTRVQGFLLRPPGFDPARKYPVKFLIHGGPEGAWSNEWSYRWNPELFAADGYVVVMINPRGSVGYGQAFVDAIDGDWGGRPYIDLMRGLDYAESRFPFIDKSRECALGASYGGYMADWILGHTQRFRCIVTHDGVFDTEAFYASTDELWFPEWEFRGPPWGAGNGRSNRALYRRWSPMLYSANFKTPTLIIHSQLDYRLDLSQGIELFTTLQRLHVPSEMLYFPDEGHWILKPQNSRLWNRTVSEWCDRYTKSENSAAPAAAVSRQRGN